MAKFDHVAFQVSDLDRAIDFYVGRLGFALAFRSINAEEQEAYAFLSRGDCRLELIQDLRKGAVPKAPVSPPYCPHLAIEVPDMSEAVRELGDSGVPILRGPLKVEGEDTWLYFVDPDNNVLEYIQWFREV